MSLFHDRNKWLTPEKEEKVKKCNFLSLFLGCTLVVVLTLSLVSCLDLVGKRPTFILKGITVSPRAWEK